MAPWLKSPAKPPKAEADSAKEWFFGSHNTLEGEEEKETRYTCKQELKNEAFSMITRIGIIIIARIVITYIYQYYY